MKEFIKSLSNGDVGEAFLALVPFFERIIFALIVWYIGRILVKWAVRLLKRICEKHFDAGVTNFLTTLVNIGLNVLLLLVVVDRIGISTSSFIAVLTSAGLAVGLALQGSLSNFAGGVLILVTKPFVVGDYIAVGGLEGTVTEVGICYTRLLTTDNRVVVLPNGGLSNSNLINVSAEPIRRVDMVVPMSYDDDIRSVKAMLSRLVEGRAGILPEKEVDIFVKEFADSSVNIGFRFWVKKEQYWDMLFEMQEEVRYAMQENGFSIPYRQLDVAIKSETK